MRSRSAAHAAYAAGSLHTVAVDECAHLPAMVRADHAPGELRPTTTPPTSRRKRKGGGAGRINLRDGARARQQALGGASCGHNLMSA
eukprot:247397-Chlamydomonas_euryale.AAC.3